MHDNKQSREEMANDSIYKSTNVLNYRDASHTYQNLKTAERN